MVLCNWHSANGRLLFILISPFKGLFSHSCHRTQSPTALFLSQLSTFLHWNTVLNYRSPLLQKENNFVFLWNGSSNKRLPLSIYEKLTNWNSNSFVLFSRITKAKTKVLPLLFFFLVLYMMKALRVVLAKDMRRKLFWKGAKQPKFSINERQIW